MATRLAEKYRKEVVPKLMEQFHYANTLAVPRLTHVTVNVGLGKQKDNEKAIEATVQNMSRITGQKPLMTRAKKSISNFKVRQGQVIGAKVTLRGRRMEEFLDKVISVTLPRVRDFRGLSTHSFGKKERQYTIGLQEHNVFPEIKSDEVEMLHGIEVSIASTAKTAEESRALLTALGFPFAHNEDAFEKKPKRARRQQRKASPKKAETS